MGHSHKHHDKGVQGESGAQHDSAAMAHSGPSHGCPTHGDGAHHSQGRLAIAAVITGLFMVAEVVGGLISGSLALLADAGHMLTDFGALALAWAGFSMAKRPASPRHHFGFERFQILTAFVNGLTLIAVSVWIFMEAVKRLITPGEVLAGPMLIVAIIGLLVNLFVFWLLIGADRENLNIRGAVLHVLGDLLGSVAAIVAALVIMQTGWVKIDPILSFLVVLLILRSAWRLTTESAHILLEGAPRSFDSVAVKAALLKNHPDIAAIEMLRVWSITPKHIVATLKVEAAQGADLTALRHRVTDYFKDELHIEDVTLELTHVR